jgi:endonuclease YncB( thermonuclease family)
MPAGTRLRGASGPAAPFLFPALFLCVLLLAGSRTAAATGDRCGQTRIDARSRVTYVFDGDTVKLQDGRRVRLIGINTPELGHKGAHDEPLAVRARDVLEQILDSGDRTVLLQYGSETHDHYGRLLAHVFLQDGENVAVPLLQKGLATTLVVPPNTGEMHCYREVEDRARARRTGLWALDRYQATDSTTLRTTSRGFRIVHGRVTAVRKSRKSTWVDLEGLLTVHISNRDRNNFPKQELESLRNRKIEVRGWIRPSGKRLQMTVRHPAALAVLGNTAAP